MIPSKDKFNPLNNEERIFIGLAHIESNTGKMVGKGSSLDTKSMKSVFESGDLLYGKLRPYLNKVTIADFDGVCSTDILVFKSSRNYNTNYIKYFLMNDEYVEYATKNMRGVQHPRINYNTMSKYVISLPPLSEQNRIVEKINLLFTDCDVSIHSLNKSYDKIIRYQKSLFNKAFRGDLTKRWRSNNEGNIKDSSLLLDEVLSKRRTMAQGRMKNEWEIKKAKLDPLPDGWNWAPLRNLSWYVTSGSRNWSEFYSDSGALFIRTQDITTNKISLENMSYVDLPDNIEGKRSLVELNDLLFIITGQIGSVALMEKDLGETYVSQSVALMKLVMPEMAKYVHYSLICEAIGKKQLEGMIYGIGRPVLNLNNVQEVVIPVPPFAEQEKIVTILNTNYQFVENALALIALQLDKIKALKKNILRNAFLGDFVKNDLQDDSNNNLLRNIKLEKATIKDLQSKYKKNDVMEEIMGDDADLFDIIKKHGKIEVGKLFDETNININDFLDGIDYMIKKGLVKKDDSNNVYLVGK